jgi:hypothetical protein
VASFDETKSQNPDLIRKALGGAFFLAPITADAVTTLTTYTAPVTGPPAVPAKIDLTELPVGYEDLGYLSDDGVGFENETSQSDVSSWQSTTPTRSDMISDTDSLTVVAQETKLLTIGLYTGAQLTAASRAANTGEVAIAKPERPSARFYRGIVIAVDGEGEDETFIARFYPRLKVTGKNAQAFGKGDDPIAWGVTFQAFFDASLGYSAKFLFGGTGWKSRLGDMGFTPLS